MSELAINGGQKAVSLPIPMWPQVGEEEIQAVVSALRKSSTDMSYLTSLVGGEALSTFEEGFAEFIGREYALTTNGCGTALHTALAACGIEAGDEVIVSPYSYGQSVACVLQQNAIPIFADVNPETYTLDPKSVEEKITPYTKAVIVVHIFGHPADMSPIMDIARRHKLRVIEDCAQSTGSLYRGKKTGAFGDVSCFSLGDGKPLIGGEGGVLLTDHQEIFERAVLMSQGFERQDALIRSEELKKRMDKLMYSYRIHPLAAVIANVQLKYVDCWNQQRRQNATFLSDGLKDVPGIKPPAVAEGCEHVWYIYSPTFVPEEVEGISRERYVKALEAEGVAIDLGYARKPIHLRLPFRERQYFQGKGLPWSGAFVHRKVEHKAGDCPVAEDRCENKELSIGILSSRWRGDQRPLLKQYLDAFGKVADKLDELREVST